MLALRREPNMFFGIPKAVIGKKSGEKQAPSVVAARSVWRGGGRAMDLFNFEKFRSWQKIDAVANLQNAALS